MKQHILIVSFWIVSLCVAFALKSSAQENATRPSTVTKLGAETTLSQFGDSAIIECDDDLLFRKLFATHYQLFQKFFVTWITNLKGSHQHYTIYLSKGDADIIVKWAKTNL